MDKKPIDYSCWGMSELIERINDLETYTEELIFLVKEADELLEPREDSYAEKWRERVDSYITE